MRVAGIDIGSRFIKLVLIEKGKTVFFKKTEASFNPLENCFELLKDIRADTIIATGYGRHLLEIHQDIKTITEIKAFAIGAKTIFPKCRTIIDIGGQDTKVISLNEKGIVKKFEMNDRCAAGTGKFLEIMAKALDYRIEKFGSEAVNNSKEIQISSMCTVFAESEVVSLISKGMSRKNITIAIHRAIANKVV
ncbi:MAG TPA: activase, partial [Elusimicrobia bacterium]|nr:activase [Elusimicrobiota bacterium]